ncbi:PulJ/GspJ family protein [Gimesia chilikensis]|uniref:PulJ/GspJ family protein n=1 Tax=Gimesia chilikensis TaxID=2605989 RepID=UPI003A90D228
MNECFMIMSDKRRIQRRSCTKFRQGFSLIEMLAVMSAMSILFTAAVTTLAFLMRVEMKGTERLENQLVLQKIAHKFREDVSTAQNAEISKQNSQQILKLVLRQNTSVTYLTNSPGEGIRREYHKEGKLVSQDEYLLPLAGVTFQTQKINQQELVSMELKIPDVTGHENQTLQAYFQLFRCEAQLDRVGQIQKQSEQTE